MDKTRVYRAYKNKHSTTEGFLEDYAFLIQSYIALYQVTFQEDWLRKAERWMKYVVNYFYDATEGYFHFSSSMAEQLVAKKKEVFDNVIPSSNSVMARNLLHLGTLLDHDEWKKMALEMSSRLADITQSEPSYMSNWGILFAEITNGLAEVVMVGSDIDILRKELHQHPLPFTLTLGTTTHSNLSLLENRAAKDGNATIFVCHNKVCKLPVSTVKEALDQL